MFGIIGRWGGEAEQDLASEILSDLAYTKIEGGLSWWIDLKLYPSVLLFYAYGLGVLKAGNYDLLFRWCAQRVRREQHKSLPFVVRIGNWWAETHDQWKMLEGLDRAKTPLSDHLHTVTAPWSSDYALAVRDHTRHFEMFEILSALAFLTFTATKKDFEEAHTGDPNSRNFIWSPVTRASWDNSTRDLILTDLEQSEIRAAMLKAGFGSKDEKHLELAIESMRRLMGRIAWY